MESYDSKQLEKISSLGLSTADIKLVPLDISTKGKYLCGGCGNYKITNPKAKMFCGLCEEKGLTTPSEIVLSWVDTKICKTCNTQKIFECIVSNECYLCDISKRMRKCVDCGVHRIGINEAHWKRRCVKCYQLSKK